VLPVLDWFADSIEANIESASVNVVRGSEHIRQARSHLVTLQFTSSLVLVCPMLSDRCLSVCQSVLSVMSVTLVYCGQTVERIKMKLGTQVGLGPVHIVLGGEPAPPPQCEGAQYLAHICCDQMAGWIKMPLGMEVCLGPGQC